MGASTDIVGRLTIDIADRSSTVALEGGATYEIPVGPLTIREGDLEGADTPTPAQLSNALGTVHDHLDDVFIAAPGMLAPTSVVVRGPHALALARVEYGSVDVPAGYRLRRADADEVFRIVATEDPSERIHNPGLDPGHLHTIIPTCCIVLGTMRRLALDEVEVDPLADDPLADDPLADVRTGEAVEDEAG
jgi:exopolyphosphatase/pppGpp-phosphohydrolase